MPPVEHMKTSLDHLPDDKQAELKRIVEILFEELDDLQKLATTQRAKAGRILKIILFGSFARPGKKWVDDKDKTSKGYQSDYDILLIVNHDRLAEPEKWATAEDRFAREIPRPVGLIVHTLADVNNKLHEDRYFFVDIIEDGIALYELAGHKLTAPAPKTPQQALEQAEKYYKGWMELAANKIKMFGFALSEGMLNEAAFNVHQTVESLYACYLLVTTYYSPPSHNIKHLRSLAEDRDERLREVWPKATKFEQRCFARLKDAYVKARYSEFYEITRDELVWLGERASVLREKVKAACEERIEELRREAD